MQGTNNHNIAYPSAMVVQLVFKLPQVLIPVPVHSGEDESG